MAYKLHLLFASKPSFFCPAGIFWQQRQPEMERLKRFWKDQGGVTAAGYGMVVALVAAAVILTMAAVRS